MVIDEHVLAIVTGLLRRGGRGLLVHRTPTRRWYPDCWDLPGGHVEDSEKPEAALRREFVDELGVAATVSGPPADCFHSTTFRMAVCVIDEWEGEPTNVEPGEHDAIAWKSYQETTTLKLAHTGLATLLRAALPQITHRDQGQCQSSSLGLSPFDQYARVVTPGKVRDCDRQL